MPLTVKKGNFKQKGAYLKDGEVTFTFVAAKIDDPAILLFDRTTLAPIHTISIPTDYRIGRVYSISIAGLPWERLCYQIRVDDEIVSDTHATSIIGRETWMDESRYANGYKVYQGFSDFNYKWQNVSPEIPAEQMMIYKLHIRGFTMDHGLHASMKGNYKGVQHYLPQLKEFGITTLEFLPLYEFEEIRFRTHKKLDANNQAIEVAEPPFGTNYWGYGRGDYFAPKASYFGGKDASIHMMEMVDAIHSYGMEIVMEVSFTGEETEDFIVEVLDFWMRRYHLDGFHILGADVPMKRISENPYFADLKIFYNNIPADVLYGESDKKHLFVTGDDFTYPLRRLQHHMDGNIAEFCDQMKKQAKHYGFVNYAASNTGFCLYDVYCYGEKHNMENGEDNIDGSNYNCSHNHGAEGPTKKKNINRIRLMNARTAITATLLGQGVPLILAGDECNNTQNGNNNPYCQDNETGWTNFPKRKSAAEFYEYVKQVIAFRKAHPLLSSPIPMQMTDYRHTGMPDLSYHGREPWVMGIGAEKKAIGILYNGAYSPSENTEDVMLLFNFYYGEETFALPKLSDGRKWFFVTNTANEVFAPAAAPLENQSEVVALGGTITILVGRDVASEKLSRTKRPAKGSRR